MSVFCTCPQLGTGQRDPHRHLVVGIQDVRPGDSNDLFRVTQWPFVYTTVPGETVVSVEVLYHGGLRTTNDYLPGQQLAVRRPLARSKLTS